jgi:hypothetical protein
LTLSDLKLYGKRHLILADTLLDLGFEMTTALIASGWFATWFSRSSVYRLGILNKDDFLKMHSLIFWKSNLSRAGDRSMAGHGTDGTPR